MYKNVEKDFMLKKPFICKGNIVYSFTTVVMILKRHEQRYYKRLFFKYWFGRVQSPTWTIFHERYLKKKMTVQTLRIWGTKKGNFYHCQHVFLRTDTFFSRKLYATVHFPPINFLLGDVLDISQIVWVC